MEHVANSPDIHLRQRIAAWLVHGLTASTAVIGVYTLYAIYHQRYIVAFWLMGAAIFIDAIDGTLARLSKAHIAAARIDGALLDNIVDYLNYVITPAFFLIIHPGLLPPSWAGVIVSAIVLASAYQFTQSDAKTDDHFFKGFPSYWNFAVFYLFLFNMSAITNTIILLTLAVLVFVPIKYVYPSRMDHLSKNPFMRKFMLAASIVYGIVTASMVWLYPQKSQWLLGYTYAYLLFYFGFSIYRTFVPLEV